VARRHELCDQAAAPGAVALVGSLPRRLAPPGVADHVAFGARTAIVTE
jgi:hypothetical protein